MPCLSAVWVFEDRIHFFVQVANEVVYATVERIGDDWKVL